MRATGDTLPFRAVDLLLAGAARALLASRWRFPGEALSRESLTQDSRSAVKARSFDPSVDHSARGIAPLAKLAWRPRERPSRGFERFVTRRNALESRADRGMRAYVTSCSDDAQTSAMRARYGLTPRRVASSRLAAHERREGLRVARTACWRRSLDVARMKAGDACGSLQVRGGSGGNAQGSGWRDGPRRFDGDARRKHAHGQSRRSATLTLLDAPLHVWRGAV